MKEVVDRLQVLESQFPQISFGVNFTETCWQEEEEQRRAPEDRS